MLKRLLRMLLSINKTPTYRIYSHGLSDTGRTRRLNEDSYLISDDNALFVVADGMGGHDAGEVASRVAVETLSKELIPHNDIDMHEINATEKINDAVAETNHQVHKLNVERGYPEGSGMGTTVAGLWLKQNKGFALSFHIGDSRIYRFRNNVLSQITVDHTHHQLWLDTGKVGMEPNKNIIFKAVGPWQRLMPDISTHKLHHGDIYLLCSDGLTGMLSDDDIFQILQQTNSKNISDSNQKLIDMANDAGGTDNITSIIAYLEQQ